MVESAFAHGLKNTITDSTPQPAALAELGTEKFPAPSGHLSQIAIETHAQVPLMPDCTKASLDVILSYLWKPSRISQRENNTFFFAIWATHIPRIAGTSRWRLIKGILSRYTSIRIQTLTPALLWPKRHSGIRALAVLCQPHLKLNILLQTGNALFPHPC